MCQVNRAKTLSDVLYDGKNKPEAQMRRIPEVTNQFPHHVNKNVHFLLPVYFYLCFERKRLEPYSKDLR